MYQEGQVAIRKQQKMVAQQGDTSGKKDIRAELLQANPQLRTQLRQNQRILGDVQSAKLARAVSSDRQLQEVMTDFWENHFTIFAGKGLDRIFIDAGAEWRQAGCSMCLGMNPDQLAPGERSASTSNRNFEGRQGKGGRTHLVSPLVAAATALTGHLASPAEL